MNVRFVRSSCWAREHRVNNARWVQGCKAGCYIYDGECTYGVCDDSSELMVDGLVSLPMHLCFLLKKYDRNTESPTTGDLVTKTNR